MALLANYIDFFESFPLKKVKSVKTHIKEIYNDLKSASKRPWNVSEFFFAKLLRFFSFTGKLEKTFFIQKVPFSKHKDIPLPAEKKQKQPTKNQKNEYLQKRLPIRRKT